MSSTTLRLALNATPLASPSTGIGNYVRQLGSALAETGEVDLFSFYRMAWRHETPQAQPETAVTAAPAAMGRLRRQLPFLRPLWHAAQRARFVQGLRRHGIELYHEPNYVPLSYALPVVVTVHDLSWLHYPEAHPIDRVRWLEKGLPRALDRAAAIMVDSDFVRSEVLSTFGVAPDRVHTAYLSAGSTFRPRAAGETHTLLEALALIHGQYVLAVATIEPRKNLAHLLKAYALLPMPLRERYPLVVAGAKGWHSRELEATLDDLARRGQLRFLGAVSETSLAALYAGAGLFVFPSLYEGFGLPPLEAMASGAPVIVANRGSLPEIAGDGTATIDPLDVDGTAQAISQLLASPEARQALSARGLQRAKAFSWAQCARITLDVYHAVHRSA